MRYISSLLAMSGLIFHINAFAQNWVDLKFQITQEKNIAYGEATDFAGKNRTLTLDVSYPSDDVVPACGRPFILLVHGGAFMAGTKEDGNIQHMLSDFAKRGYVTASINYRLGMFQTDKSIHCNIETWDCLNQADSAEWGRSLYRGVQDAATALNYMIRNKAKYQIDARNVFIIGESAGAFVSLCLAYMDDTEKPWMAGAIPDVPRPNAIYQNACVDYFQWGTPISEMNLARPDLGAVNRTEEAYEIKGVGAFYGGLFGDLFSHSNNENKTALYMFHQPNDLIVPFQYDKILQGTAACASSMGGCQDIINRPHVRGSKGIKDLIDELDQQGVPVPEYYADFSDNNADCLTQILFPATTGHAIDNYGLRTNNLAVFFSQYVESGTGCLVSAENTIPETAPEVFPNPFDEHLNIRNDFGKYKACLFNSRGQLVMETTQKHINTAHLPTGFYLLKVVSGENTSTFKVVKIR